LHELILAIKMNSITKWTKEEYLFKRMNLEAFV